LQRGQSARSAVGIDFGTTNSSIALADSSGSVELATFPFAGAITDAYRSLLYLEKTKSWTGPEGIEQYLSADQKGRLIQSLKSFLSSRTLLSTEVFGRRRTLEELISRIIKDLREKAEHQFGLKIREAVVGRPVRFVGAEDDDQSLYAETRLSEAFHLAGFDSIQFEMEPVAAAHYYESTLDHDELILIGDFGGGTSDFSLIHVGPGTRSRKLLGNAGVGLAGDAFDAKIIRNLVSPALGAGTQIRSMGKVLPAPTWVYAKLERWHHLSFLKSRDVMNMLNSVLAQADHPDKIAAFLHLIQEDLGYQLHRAVQKTKCDLSIQETARFQFDDGSIQLDFTVHRSDFEFWICEELAQIEQCVDALVKDCGIEAAEVDMVFLTGGSSFVPAVRRIFESRFGAHRIRAGNEFTSVARGLALKALKVRRGLQLNPG
jgi:hypothetical chaperone protein